VSCSSFAVLVMFLLQPLPLLRCLVIRWQLLQHAQLQALLADVEPSGLGHWAVGCRMFELVDSLCAGQQQGACACTARLGVQSWHAPGDAAHWPCCCSWLWGCSPKSCKFW
jgi:hypothetical protein